MPDLSVLIPSRNEMFLSKTIEDIIAHARADTEVVAVADGCWPDPVIQDHPRVHLIHHSQSIGQRAATNEAARLATGKYVMKCDAHCAFDEGFDVKLMADMQDDWTMVPIMRNLHAFDWVCPDGHRRYQGPSGPCKECGKPTTRDVVWFAKPSPQSTSYCFDSEPHFGYFREFSKRPEGRGEITDTMSLQGSCFMMTGDKFFELGVCDESFGSWGSQGIEVAVKTWLSGGRVVCNHKTFYAHCFRTQGGDFGFPYKMPASQVEHAKKMARDLFFGNKWEKQIRPLSWLIEKFWPIPGWNEEDLRRVVEAGSSFSIVSPLANLAGSHPLTSGRDNNGIGEEMPSDAVSLSAIDTSSSIGAGEIHSISHEFQMGGVTTASVLTKMVEDENVSVSPHRQRGNQPSVDDAVDQVVVPSISGTPIPITTNIPSPNPALTQRVDEVNLNPRKEPVDGLVVESGNCEIIRGSHDSTSHVELWSGSERPLHRSDPIIP